MNEMQPDIDRIAKEATLKGIEQSINIYLERVESLSKEYRKLADELYTHTCNEGA